MSTPAPSSPSRVRGGLLSVLAVLALLGLVVVLIVALRARRLYRQVVADRPTVVAYQPTPAEATAMAAKVKETDTALRRGETVSVEATVAEINTALSTQKHLARFRELFTVLKIENDVATIQASIPLHIASELKFVNCEIDLSLRIRGGQAEYQLRHIRAQGQELPADVVEQVEKYGLKLVKEDPKVKREIERIENLEIKAGKVFLTVKPRRAAPAPASEAGAEDEAGD